MKTINSILTLAFGLVSALSVQSCVKEEIYAIPMVDLNVSFAESNQSQMKSAVQSVCLYLYPNFDYKADPIVVTSNSMNIKVPLLPGDYGVLLHNQPIDPVVVSGADDYSTLMLTLPKGDDGFLKPCPSVYALKATDAMRKITISRDDPNSFTFTPIIISKKIRFVINCDGKFGEMVSARATLNGVATQVNLSTLSATNGLVLSIDDFAINTSQITSRNYELLGFTTNEEKIILTLFVKNKEVQFELEQPIDLTDYVKDLVGDQIEITISVTYDPDIRIHPITIKQWQEGSDIEIGIK